MIKQIVQALLALGIDPGKVKQVAVKQGRPFWRMSDLGRGRGEPYFRCEKTGRVITSWQEDGKPLTFGGYEP